MKKIVNIRYIAGIMAVMAVAAAPLWGISCFKKVSHDTRIVLRANLQSESGGEVAVAQGVEAYACNLGEMWEINSYEDAVNRIATNETDGSTMNIESVVEAEPYEWNDVEGILSMHTKWPHVLLVAVYPAAKMYAWRHYDTAENLPQTWLAFQFRPWKSSGYTDSNWHVDFAGANDNYDEQ